MKKLTDEMTLNLLQMMELYENKFSLATARKDQLMIVRVLQLVRIRQLLLQFIRTTDAEKRIVESYFVIN